MLRLIPIAFLATGLANALAVRQSYSDLPTVDLGYGRYRATFNQTAQYYNFSFIRYAKPPIGDLRFKAPVALSASDRNETVDDGQNGAICWQAHPAWELSVPAFTQAYLTNQPLNNLTNASFGGGALQPKTDGRSTEDCLKLSVYASKNAFDSKQSASNSSGAPVLVYLFGGGYTEGYIDSDGNPAGLFERTKESKLSSSGLIFVSLNYRLGAFGFLAGPNFQAHGTANAGFYDQRLALEWVQKNIHRFGGDKNKVTVMGESAGGGSIEHQITAFGGTKRAPFQRAIPQSPGFFPIASNAKKEFIYQSYLKAAGVSTFADLQKLPEATLVKANVQLVQNAEYGQFFFGPAVDGNFVPELPGLLLKHGRYDTRIKLLAAHNLNEGLIFTPAAAQSDNVYINEVSDTLDGYGSPPLVDFVANTLYPPVYDGSKGYRDQISRYSFTVADLGFVCNAYFLEKALKGSYGYVFTALPSLHGQDVGYTFYVGKAADRAGLPVNTTLASIHQRYILNFVSDANPNGPGLPQFDVYGSNNNVQSIGNSGVAGFKDTVVAQRCDFWQDGLVA